LHDDVGLVVVGVNYMSWQVIPVRQDSDAEELFFDGYYITEHAASNCPLKS